MRSAYHRRDLLAGLVAGSALLTGCIGNFSLRYRLTMNVVVGGRRVSGSNVREVRWHQRMEALGSLDTSGYAEHGDATIVDLGQGRLLVALLCSKGYGFWSAVPAFDRALQGGVAFWRKRSGVTVPLLPNEMPLLVTFGDRLNPNSVQEVEPGDLAAVFGAGAKLESITVEIAHARRTLGEVQRVFPWLKTMTPFQSLSGAKGSNRTRPADHLSRENFTDRGPEA